MIDLDELDFGILVPELKITTPEPRPWRKKPKCECGAGSIGIKNYMIGHQDYCPVREGNTPVMYER